MKIGIDIRTLMDSQYSGVSYYTFELLTHLFKIDKKNKYKLFYNSAKDVKKIRLFSNYSQVEIIKTNYPNKLFNYVLQKGFKYPKIDKILGGIDVFFAPHFNFFSLSNNCKKIITVHDLSFVLYKDFFSYRKNIWHKMLNISQILKQFDKIITVSNNTKKDIIEYYNIPEEKIKVIHSGINKKYQKLDNNLKQFELIKNKYSLPNKFILCLGNIEPRKNIENVILAFDKYCQENIDNDLKLVIVGGNGWKNKRIFQILNKINNSDKINFIGYVNEEDKVFIYNLAEIFIYISFYEGFGFPPLEAMACALPTIVSNNSSLPEVVKNTSLMINADNITEIKQAIYLLQNNNKIKKILIEKGLANVDNYLWKNVVNQYLTLIDSLL